MSDEDLFLLFSKDIKSSSLHGREAVEHAACDRFVLELRERVGGLFEPAAFVALLQFGLDREDEVLVEVAAKSPLEVFDGDFAKGPAFIFSKRHVADEDRFFKTL